MFQSIQEKGMDVGASNQKPEAEVMYTLRARADGEGRMGLSSSRGARGSRYHEYGREHGGGKDIRVLSPRMCAHETGRQVCENLNESEWDGEGTVRMGSKEESRRVYCACVCGGKKSRQGRWRAGASIAGGCEIDLRENVCAGGD
jgi:hypothetical protein